MTRGRPRKPVPTEAVAEVRSGASLKATAKKYEIGLATLWRECEAHLVRSVHKCERRGFQKAQG